ncbi:MAG: outer membrane beta-barrel protein [Flavobacteriaceae bacterium]|nr:outer membrane beta-barrel protein [Flavobacteriaceae bacterium]
MKFIYQLTFVCLFNLLFLNNLSAQSFEIKGRVVDSIQDFELANATIFAETQSDSTLISYTVTDQKGEFVLTGKTKEEKINLVVSYTSFSNHYQEIDVSEKIIDVGTIRLQEATELLDDVLVKTRVAPVVLKTDTLEFNSKSFRTRENANLEDVLKQLPGVEVDAQGNIKVNGQDVSRVLINGKEFFGDDPKIATKNLPKEIIDKIQVVDTKTREEQFTGKEAESEDKTINITIEEDKNKGFFSRASAGHGTNDRYDVSGIANYFENEKRISVLASTNNINSSGFSFDEVFDALGRSAFGLDLEGGNSGITTSRNVGGNYVDEWEDGKYDLVADYFFGGTDTENRSSVIRENILPDRSFFTNTETDSRVRNDSHRASARLEINLDSMTRITYEPRVNINISESLNNSFSENAEANGDLINTVETSNVQDNIRSDFQNRLSLTRKFGDKGSYVTARINAQNNRQDNENIFFSERTIFNTNEVDLQDQLIDVQANDDQYSTRLSYRQNLKENLFLDMRYDLELRRYENRRNVFDFDATTSNYSDFNENLSNEFKATSNIHTPTVGLRYESEKIRTGGRIGLLNANLNTDNLTQNLSFDNSFNAFSANAFLYYKFTRSKSLWFNYRNNANIPSVQQLQPVEIVTNPANIIVGNPDLSPSFNQTFRLSFRNYDFKTRSGYNLFASVTHISDQVVPVLFTNEDLVRTTTYTNVNGAMRGNVYAGYNNTLDTEGDDVMRYNIGLSGNFNRNIGFSNEVKFTSDIYTVSPSVSFTYERPDVFQINPKVQLNYNNTAYDIFSNRNEDFTNTELGLQSTLFWPKNFTFGNDLSYYRFGNVSDAFDSTSLMWNMSLGYQFLDDRATLKLIVYDLLKQNIATRRVTGEDFIQDVNQLILQRYAMLSFTYKFSRFGGMDGAPNTNKGGGRYYRR